MPPRAQLEKDYSKTLADCGIGNRTAFMIERVYAEEGWLNYLIHGSSFVNSIVGRTETPTGSVGGVRMGRKAHG
jgi:hypothetical protein